MPKSWSAKQERQYKRIKRSCVKKRCKRGRGMCFTECERVAAATVNKMRLSGSTRKRARKTKSKGVSGCGCDGMKPLPAK